MEWLTSIAYMNDITVLAIQRFAKKYSKQMGLQTIGMREMLPFKNKSTDINKQYSYLLDVLHRNRPNRKGPDWRTSR